MASKRAATNKSLVEVWNLEFFILQKVCFECTGIEISMCEDGMEIMLKA